MGGHDHHHHQEFKCPDWRQYKLENAPELMEVQRALDRVGLKNPWLRNEVWRFDRTTELGKYSKWYRFRRGMFRGLSLGVALTALTVAAEKAFGVDYHNPRGLEKFAHAHHGGEHDEHH